MFIGINAVGAMIAAFLSGRIYGKDNRPFGIFKTSTIRGEKRQLYEDWLPPSEAVLESVRLASPKRDAKREVIALVVDGQLKTGRNWVDVKAALEKFYRRINLRMYYLAFVACGINRDNRDRAKEGLPWTMDELFCAPVNSQIKVSGPWHLPDFLAYVSVGNVKTLPQMP